MALVFVCPWYSHVSICAARRFLESLRKDVAKAEAVITEEQLQQKGAGAKEGTADPVKWRAECEVREFICTRASTSAQHLSWRA
jgi:hypothetical protein